MEPKANHRPSAMQYGQISLWHFASLLQNDPCPVLYSSTYLTTSLIIWFLLCAFVYKIPNSVTVPKIAAFFRNLNFFLWCHIPPLSLLKTSLMTYGLPNCVAFYESSSLLLFSSLFFFLNCSDLISS